MRIRRHLSWEDGALAIFVGLWATVGSGMALFHLYTVGLMGLILSIGISRGLAAALSRTVIVTSVLLLVAGWQGRGHAGHSADVVSMMACAALAAFLGDRERRARERLKGSFAQTLEALAQALEARDPYTEGHSRRTSTYAVTLARRMGLDEHSQSVIAQAGVLHDLGKIGTPDEVLRKSGPLTAHEKELMEQHPVVGSRILKGVTFLEEAAGLVRHHHERYDGSGYPDGLAGSAIPLGARILTVADVFDALTTDRPYRKASRPEEAMRNIEAAAGHHFDPAVVQVLRTYQMELTQELPVTQLPGTGA